MICIRWLLILCLLPGLSACKQDDRVHENGVIFCVGSLNQNLNPQLHSSGMLASSVSQQIYNRLLEVNPYTQQLDGSLATHWQVSPDGLVYTFTLRQGVRFQTTDWFTPSREFNAEDVVFSFRRLLDARHPFHRISGGRYPFFDNLRFSELVRSVRALSPWQVQFVLSRPDASFLANLASDYAVILSAEYGARLQTEGTLAWLDHRPVGTGPFKVKEYRPEEFLRLYRHDGYWEGPPPLSQLVFDYTPKASKRLTKLMTGECQVMVYPAVTQLPFIRQDPSLDLVERNSLNTAFLALNTGKAPFNDVRVRQALAMAIDRQTLLQAVYYDSGQKADNLLPPLSWAHDANLKGPDFDLQAARKLLTRAGYPRGFAMTLWVQPGERAYNPDALKTAQLVQADLARLGIRVTITQLKWSIMRTQLREGRHDGVIMGWAADTADPDNILRPLLSCDAAHQGGLNISAWCNPQFDRLLDDALTTRRLSQRVQDYHEAQALLAREMPLIPLAHALSIHAFRSNLHQVEVTPMGGLSLKRAYQD